MVEVLGGALVMLGGGALSASSIALARHQARSSIERARELLGNTDAAVPPAPADLRSLLAQLD